MARTKCWKGFSATVSMHMCNNLIDNVLQNNKF